jgi:hypothetical protein
MHTQDDEINGTPCEICKHPSVKEINKDLLQDPSGADYYAEVYGVDPALLFRHGVCIQSVILTHIFYLEKSAKALQTRADNLLASGSNVPSYLRSAQSAISAAADLRSEALKLRGYHASQTEFAKSPPFRLLKKEIGRALAPFPEALSSVLSVFLKAEGEGSK